jgi:hypothetical protein
VTDLDWEARARRAEAALEDALRERNELWEELHRRAAVETALEECRAANERFEASLSWRITAPLRRAKAAGIRARTLVGRGRTAVGRGS